MEDFKIVDTKEALGKMGVSTPEWRHSLYSFLKIKGCEWRSHSLPTPATLAGELCKEAIAAMADLLN